MSLTEIRGDVRIIDKIEDRFAVVERKQKELEVKQSEAIVAHSAAVVQLSNAITSLVAFVTEGGLASLLQQHTKNSAIKSLLQGLTSNEGRKGLDARTLEQNAIDGYHAIEAWERVAKEREELKEQEEVSDEIVDGEEAFKKWRDEQG